jgi:AraC-like DNA-binding protein
MFSKLLPYKSLENYKTPPSVIRAFELIHDVTNTPSYRSIGEYRATQTHCIFHYTVKGRGEVVYKGVPYPTVKGQGFFNIINEKNSGYGYPQDGTESWEYVVICFEGGNVREIVKDLSERQVVYTLKNEEDFAFACNRLNESDRFDMRLTFFQRLLGMLFNSDVNEQGLVAQFQKAVNENILCNPTIETLARELGVSREHLQRDYAKKTGKTPARYLSEKRFEKLCFLLSTKKSPQEIVKLMNFSSYSSMSAFFNKHSQTTLKQFKRDDIILI